MKKLILFCILCLLFLSSCSKINLEKLYNSGDYQAVYDSSTELLKEEFSSSALYYKALASYRLGFQSDAVNSARLFILLYPREADEKIAMERVVLHYGDMLSSLEAGEHLESDNMLSKEDSIQYYKVLIDNGLYTRATVFLRTLDSILNKAEFAFCLINGNAPIWQITYALDNLYSEEGCSTAFLSGVRAMISSLDPKTESNSVSIFLDRTFDGNSQYAIIIGDFYYSIKQYDKMRYYWNLAKEDYPEAIDVRLRIVK